MQTDCLRILSINHLAWHLGVPREQLRVIADNIRRHYRVRKRYDPEKNKTRILRVPKYDLKRIQHRINDRILSEYHLDDAAHGGVAGRSPKSNAEMHLGQPCVVNIDVHDFFPSVSHKLVYRLFHQELGYGRDVSGLLTRLTTINGELPQGAPTSPKIANLLLSRTVDHVLRERFDRSGVRYTRFVDDVTMSGDDPRPLISHVGKQLSHLGLRLWRPSGGGRARGKFRSDTKGSRQEITGLVINGPQPTVSRSRRNAIRAAIFQLNSVTAPKATQSLLGRIRHVGQFNSGSARRLLRQLNMTLERLPTDRRT